MRIEPFPASNKITHNIEFKTCPANILVDCGNAQSSDPETPFDQFPVPPKKIHYLFLTQSPAAAHASRCRVIYRQEP